jgi:histidinol dehydrogenase
MDFREERNMILDMVAEGRITVEDARQLLDALEASAKKTPEPRDDFFTTPGFDFHVPEVRIPNVDRIVQHAVRHATPGFHGMRDEFDEMRGSMEDELENLRVQIEDLKEQARHITEEIEQQVREATDDIRRDTEKWD